MTASVTFSGPRFYNDLLGPLWFDPMAEDLARRLPERPAGDVLEIACGTGLVTRRLRQRLHPSAGLVATDLARTMLDFARESCRDLAGIEWREADAQKLPFEEGRFGAAVCGFGIMFMPDRLLALREARRVLAKDGLLLFSVWDRVEENPHALSNARTLEALFPGDAAMRFRLPYDMHDSALLRRLLAQAGFRELRIDTRRISFTGNPRDIATGQIRGTPRSALIEQRGLPLEVAIEKVTEALARDGGNPYRGYAQAVIVEASAI